MSRLFDKKFGSDFFQNLPDKPGVYVFSDNKDVPVYVGKAKNLRRRIGQYRNAKRRKKHLKMLTILKNADNIRYHTCPSHLDACLLETRLIQELRPRWNVAGAFFFMYPMIGVAKRDSKTYFCYTTSPDTLQKSLNGFKLHGAFRSREHTWNAFSSLMQLLNYIGHRTKSREFDRIKRTYLYSFRQIPDELEPLIEKFFKGDSEEVLMKLVLALVENASARNKKKLIQQHLENLNYFWENEITPLKRARSEAAYDSYPVPQNQRDMIFVKYRLNAGQSG